MKKKNVFLLGMLAMVPVLGFVGCASFGGFGQSGGAVFTPSAIFNNPGYFAAGDTVGSFKNGSADVWKFSLTSGDGSTDNSLFEIRNNNTLVARSSLPAKGYSIRVQYTWNGGPQDARTSQDQDGQKAFTFTVTKEAPEQEQPKPSLDKGYWSSGTNGQYTFSGDTFEYQSDTGFTLRGTFTFTETEITFNATQKKYALTTTWENISSERDTDLKPNFVDKTSVPYSFGVGGDGSDYFDGATTIFINGREFLHFD